MLNRIHSFKKYKEDYKESIRDKVAFWASVAENFKWHKKWDNTMYYDPITPEIKWFEGGKLSIVENLLDVHVARTPI